MTESAALASAHRENRALTHKAGANFSVGFRFLPKERRHAVYAAYAWCRVADDAVDEGDPAGAPARLDAWEEELDAVYGGTPTSAAGIALAGSLPRFPIPKTAFQGLLAGCRQDLVKTRYATFDELLGYCDLVASTISTISLAIFGGLGNAEAEARGRDLATALQLTNVVRDVGEDVGRGRLYLPLEDLKRFGLTEKMILDQEPDRAKFERLMKHETDRARSFYKAAAEALPKADRTSMRSAELMRRIYSAILDEMEKDGYRVYERRYRLPKAVMLGEFLRAKFLG